MNTQPITLTKEDSIVALRNDYQELLSMFNPRVVLISREAAPAGAMCLLKVRVIAPTFMLQSENDVSPKSVGELTFFVKVFEGYPQVKPLVYYPPHCRLASVNVFFNGTQCTSDWFAYSSICTLVEKTVRDIVHDPCITRYDSMAYGGVANWQREMVKRGAFPTINLKDLYAVGNTSSLPRQTQCGTSHGTAGNLPPLPGKR